MSQKDYYTETKLFWNLVTGVRMDEKKIEEVSILWIRHGRI